MWVTFQVDEKLLFIKKNILNEYCNLHLYFLSLLFLLIL